MSDAFRYKAQLTFSGRADLLRGRCQTLDDALTQVSALLRERKAQ